MFKKTFLTSVQLSLSIQMLFAGNTGSSSFFPPTEDPAIVKLGAYDFYNALDYSEDNQIAPPTRLIAALHGYRGPAKNGNITFETNNNPEDVHKGCMKYGAKPNEKLSPLLFALHEDLPEVAHVIAATFPDYIWSRDSNGNTALHYYTQTVLRKSASRTDYPLCYKLLALFRPIINYANLDYLKPFLIAVSARPDLMVALHLRGADHAVVPHAFEHHTSKAHTLTSLVILNHAHESHVPEEDKNEYTELLPELSQEIHTLIQKERQRAHDEALSATGYRLSFQ